MRTGAILRMALRPRALSTWSGPQQVILNYQEPPPPGKRNGRYINQPDKGDAVDMAKNYEAAMLDGRELSPPASLETMGFTLSPCPTAVQNFRDDEEVSLLLCVCSRPKPKGGRSDVAHGLVSRTHRRVSGCGDILWRDHESRQSNLRGEQRLCV